MRSFKIRFPVIYAVILSAFTAYLLLDTFVIPRKYAVVETPGVSAEQADEDDTQSQTYTAPDESDTGSGTLFTEKTVTTDSSYSDGNISITVTEYREYDTSIYVADIYVSSPEYLKTAFAENTYGRNVTEKTSEIGESVGAILAVNGDYYGAQSSGYVVRDGVLYRDKSAGTSQEDLVIYENGIFELITEGKISAADLVQNGADTVLSFGPGLLEDGEIIVSADDEVDKAKTSNPRTAIGIVDDLHYVLAVSDGRTSESTGLSLSELAEFMQGLGVQTAYNLDGGGSSTMWFLGNVVNNPTTDGKNIKERSVSDIVYIG